MTSKHAPKTTISKTKHPRDLAGNLRSVEAPTAVLETSAETKNASTKPKPVSYEARMRALAPAVRMRKKLAANARRLEKLTNELRRWQNASEVGSAAVAVGTAFATLIGLADGLPDDFKPTRLSRGGAGTFVPGAIVALRPKLVGKYEGILDVEDRGMLQIVSVGRGGLVSVSTSRGARLVLPRAHLVAASAPSSVATDEAETTVGPIAMAEAAPPVGTA